MKGTFFQKPFEFALEIIGESWKQGDTINGTLNVKSHSPEDQDLSKIGVGLALGAAKKIKTKDAKAFKVISSTLFESNSVVKAGEETSIPWTFTLAKDCPISDKAGSIYMIAGNVETPFEAGLMELSIAPTIVISNFLEIFENMFRFKVKKMKAKKTFIEVKMQAPGSTEFGPIEQLVLQLKMDGENLDAQFNFKLSKLCYEPTGVVAKVVEESFTQTLTPVDYKIYGDSPNQDGIMKSISKVLDQVKAKASF
jgi:hypothetical protein